jgi:eukaryotic-like serine/threonine-protein kinase
VTYYPPEQIYSSHHPDFVVRRVGCDLYMLGNLIAFLFTGVNVTAAIFARLDSMFRPENWRGTYNQVLPHIQRAFNDAVIDLAPQIDVLVRGDIKKLILELCNPDIALRGHPKGIGKFSQYSLERYKAFTDLLLKRTSVSIRMRNTA